MTDKRIFTFDTDESETLSSRRNFLKQMAYGSMLALGGVSLAEAKSTHIKSAHLSHSAPHGARSHTVLAGHTSAHKSAGHAAHKAFDGHHSAHNGRSHSVVERHPESRMLANNRSMGHKTLAIQNPHTGDNVQVTYFENGRYVSGALNEISHLCRDHHTGDVYPVDPALLDQLFELKQNLGVNKPFHLVCGYRSPFTNAMLRSQSHAVAKNSLHMQGRAVDIRIEGLDTRVISNAAIAMQRGGVGFYHRDNFVHLDSGDIRSWLS